MNIRRNPLLRFLPLIRIFFDHTFLQLFLFSRLGTDEEEEKEEEKKEPPKRVWKADAVEKWGHDKFEVYK